MATDSGTAQPKKKCSNGVMVAIATSMVLLLGALNTVTSNDIFNYTYVDPEDGKTKPFNFSNSMNFYMFIAMSAMGFAWLAEWKIAQRRAFKETLKNTEEGSARSDENVNAAAQNIEEEPVEGENNNEVTVAAANAEDHGQETQEHTETENVIPQNPEKKMKEPPKWMRNPYIVLIFPAIFDLISSSLNNLALAPPFSVPGSVYQMVRGVVTVFTTLLALCVFKKKFKMFHWIGLVFVVVGIAVVGVSAYLTASIKQEDEEPVNVPMLIIGICLLLLAQFIIALLFTVEEIIFRYSKTLPSQTVCIEGVYGLFLTLVLVFPILMAIGAEDNFKAFHIMWVVQPKLIQPVVVFFFACSGYNLFGQMLTKYASASHRTIIEACRSITVWIMRLIEAQIWPGWGEVLTKYSSVQLVGFIILTLGTFFYYEIIPLTKEQVIRKREAKAKKLEEKRRQEEAALAGGKTIKMVEA